MRRKDREITDKNEIRDIIGRSKVIRNKVAFELDNCRDYVEGSITSLYESVAGCGVMTEITDMSEKLSALGVILKQYGEKTYKPDSSCASRTRVYRLEAKEVSGKANRGK